MKKLLSVLLILILLLSACNLLPDAVEKDRAPSDASIWAMDTQMDLRVYGNHETDRGGTVLEALEAELRELEGELSVTDPDSDLSLLNQQGETRNQTILTLADRAVTLSRDTDGALDVTLYPISRAWGFTTDKHQIPTPETLKALKPLVGMDRITLEGETLTLAPGTELDFGALAKGWAADRCRALMEAEKVSGILSLGGNIQTVGAKPDGSDWVIGVQDPEDAGAYKLTLKLAGSWAVVTSGDYQRYFEEAGVRYCHILDPQTLAPVRGSLRAVTVVAQEGLLADGLSTALFVLGREAGLRLWRERGDFEAIWMEEDGSVWVTPGLADKIAGGDFRVAEP